MLTKDLIRYKFDRESIFPEFIDPQDPLLLEVAGRLLRVFNNGEGKTRSELLEESKLIIEGAPCPAVIARGLEKLLLDRTEFDSAPDESLMQFRQNLFFQTSRLLSGRDFAGYQEYRQAVQTLVGEDLSDLSTRLYSDLPAYQPVTRFKSLSPERLLHRYNCAQVQGLLIRSHLLELVISGSRPALLRQLFKYLRFHQLLASIGKEGESTYVITVDGPLSLFYQTQKYGLNLARFFPAVLQQQNWQIRADIQFKNRRKYRLSLDQSCGILPYSHQFLAYVPEEIQFFQQTFQKKAPNWRIDPASAFVPLEGEFYCFPDFTLSHTSGVSTALELFHPWHASHLSARLQQLEQQQEPLLLLGISRVLLNDPLIEQTVQQSAYFSRYGFIFRDMPTMDKVLPILKDLEHEYLDSKQRN